MKSQIITVKVTSKVIKFMSLDNIICDIQIYLKVVIKSINSDEFPVHFTLCPQAGAV